MAILLVVQIPAQNTRTIGLMDFYLVALTPRLPPVGVFKEKSPPGSPPERQVAPRRRRPAAKLEYGSKFATTPRRVTYYGNVPDRKSQRAQMVLGIVSS